MNLPSAATLASLALLAPLVVGHVDPQRPKVRTIPKGQTAPKRPDVQVGTLLLRPWRPAYAGSALRQYRTSAAGRRLNGTIPARNLLVPTKTIRYADGTSIRVSLRRPLSGANNAALGIRREQKVVEQHTSPEGDFECTTQEVKLTAKSDEFLNNDYGNSSARLYPGAAFTFDDFYSGNYREVPGTRAPLTLVTDNPNVNGSPSVVVSNPSVATVRQGVATLYGRLGANGGSMSNAYQVLETNNTADFNLQLSGGAGGFGTSFSAAFGMQRSETTYTLTIDARKAMYSISAIPAANGYFVDDAANKTPNMMVIGNVVYGVRVLANVAMTFRSEADALAFKATYTGVGFNAQAAMDYIRTHTNSVVSVNGYVIGGPMNGSVALNKDDLVNEINRAMNGANYQNARPLSYQFVDRGGNILQTESATDKFRVRNCSPKTVAPKLTSARVRFRNGSDGKDRETQVSVGLFLRDGGSRLRFYQQPKIGSKYAGYADNSTVDVTLADESRGTTDRGMFQRGGGGMIRVTLNRRGDKDRWRLNGVTLYLGFSDGTTQEINWPVFREFPNTNRSSPPLDYYFDANFAAQQ